MRLTVMIPVYREPKRVADIVAKILSNGYPEKEVIVVVDGQTNPAIETALDPYRDRIAVHYNGERLGKSESLNRVALKKATDVFLMLDNDIELPSDDDYLRKLAKSMEEFDIIEIPKEAIRTTPVSRMMAIEFLSFAMISMTMARLAKRSPSMNGAAFATQALLFRQLDGFRPVMNEDMDFAARAFQLRANFGYPPELKVRNSVPDTVRDWLIQRKRWAMNNILWVKENFHLIAVHLIKTPAFLFSTILLMLPFITYLLVFFVARRFGFEFLLPLVFMISQHFTVITGLLLLTAHVHLLSGGNWIAGLAGLLVAGLTFGIFARVLRFRFNPVDFFFYYVVYSPIWLIANAFMFFVVLFKIDLRIDWKVSKD